MKMVQSKLFRQRRSVSYTHLVAAAEINILNPDSVIFGGGVINMKGFPKDYLEERLYIHMRKPYPAETLQVQYSDCLLYTSN